MISDDDYYSKEVLSCSVRDGDHPNIPHACNHDPVHLNPHWWCENHIAKGTCPRGYKGWRE